MITIPVDGRLQTTLAAVHETAIIRAEDGTVLGYFLRRGSRPPTNWHAY